MSYKRKYIIGPYCEETIFNAGGKFPKDIITIFQRHGYQAIDFRELYGGFGWRYVRDYLLDWIRLIKIPAKSIVVYIDQVAPIKSRHLAYRLLQKKSCYIIPLLEDIDTLRNTYGNSVDNYELSLLKNTKAIISQNSRMTQYLNNQGFDQPIIDLQLLDFLDDTHGIPESSESHMTVCYGGSLSIRQSGFLTKLSKSKIEYLIFGNGELSGIEKINVRYCGAFTVDECISKLRGDWGLVWNGQALSIDQNDVGSTYYNYVTPHKLSMYILCGMPVIVYEGAAAAEYVKKYHCGITIRSLDNLEERLSQISNDEYIAMQKNVLELAKKISKGYFTEQAINKLDDILIHACR